MYVAVSIFLKNISRTRFLFASLDGSTRNCTMMLILPKKIIFSGKAHFHFGWYVNKQNCYMWGSKNLRVFIQKLMHSLSMTAACEAKARLDSLKIGRTITVNEDTY